MTVVSTLDDLFKHQLQEAEERYYRRKPTVERNQRLLKESGDWREIEEGPRVWRRMASLGMGEVAGAVLTSEHPGEPVGSAQRPGESVSLLERILEENDLVGSRFLHRGSRVSRTVARVTIRRRGRVAGYGTGFLISPRLFMTNNHVLPDQSTAHESFVEFDYFERQDGTTMPTEVVDLDPDLFFLTDAPLDYTVVAVPERSRRNRPVEERGWIPLIRESGKALIGEPVNIIQHPAGRPQEIAIRNNDVIDVFEDFVHYQADTQRGSSGSCVMNMQWELAALHHAGVPKRDDQDRILLDDGTPWDGDHNKLARVVWVANEGVRISSIVKSAERALAGEDAAKRDLFADAFSRPPVKPEPFGMHGNEGVPSRASVEPAAPPRVGEPEASSVAAPAGGDSSYDIDDEALDRLSTDDVARMIAEIEQSRLDITAEGTTGGEVLVAEGDSWFDYSIAGLDIIDNLIRFFGYQIHNVAEAGDTLDNMAWGTEYRRRGWRRREKPLEETLAAVKKYRPRVVLLSGGGNDVAGEEFSSFLNHKSSNQAAIRGDFVDYMIKTYFRSAFDHICESIWEFDDGIHIVVHGYGYAPPDGRGVIRIPLTNFQFFGPWLRPALTAKGYTERRERQRIVMAMIDRFNEMLQAMAMDDPHGRIHYINLRPLIATSDWTNELHLSNSAYRRVAKEFDRVIRSISTPVRAPRAVRLESTASTLVRFPISGTPDSPVVADVSVYRYEPDGVNARRVHDDVMTSAVGMPAEIALGPGNYYASGIARSRPDISNKIRAETAQGRRLSGEKALAFGIPRNVEFKLP